MNLLYCVIRDIDPDKPTSGSMIRPLMLRAALEEVAEKVVVVDGGSRNRKRLWQSIDYNDFDAVYCELNTLPIALSDADHVPRHPFMDLHHLKAMHRRGIPVAAFYRDMHWRYPGIVSSRLDPRTYILFILHYLELHRLTSCLDHLFVPSMRMFDKIPTKFPRNQASALPPGARIRGNHIENSSRLRLLYIGGVLPPLYDLRPVLNAITNLPESELTICCREQEWARANTIYDIPDNVTIVHWYGCDLDSLYRASDGFIMYLKLDSSNYLQFSMPIKLFEAIGAGLPIITNKSTEMGNFVDRKNLGWTFETQHDLENFLKSISRNKEIVRQKRKVVEQARWNHTWNARAREIVRVLEDYMQ